MNVKQLNTRIENFANRQKTAKKDLSELALACVAAYWQFNTATNANNLLKAVTCKNNKLVAKYLQQGIPHVFNKETGQFEGKVIKAMVQPKQDWSGNAPCIWDYDALTSAKAANDKPFDLEKKLLALVKAANKANVELDTDTVAKQLRDLQIQEAIKSATKAA